MGFSEIAISCWASGGRWPRDLLTPIGCELWGNPECWDRRGVAPPATQVQKGNRRVLTDLTGHCDFGVHGGLTQRRTCGWEVPTLLLMSSLAKYPPWL